MRRAWPWLRLLLGAGILVALVAQLGADAFIHGVRVIGPGAVLLALGIGGLTTVFCALRWCLIARGIGLPLSLPGAVAEYYRALLLNAVLPAGLLGDVDRGVRHGRAAGDVARGMRAVAYERVAGQVVLLGLGGVVLFSQPGLLAALAGRASVSREFGLLALGVLATAAALAVGSRRVRAGVTAAGAEIRRAVLSRDGGPQALVLSVLALAGHVALFVAAARVAGVTAPVADLLPLAVLALLAMSLPVNLGGWGPREAASAAGFAAAGIGAGPGLATAVVYGVLALVAGTPGAVVLAAQAAGQRRGLRPAVPGHHREQHQQDRGQHRAADRPDGELGDDRADHHAHQPERGQPAQWRDEQADRPGDLHHAGHVPEPVAEADPVERLGDVRIAGQHRQRREDHQVAGQPYLQQPHRYVLRRRIAQRAFVRGHRDLPSPVGLRTAR